MLSGAKADCSGNAGYATARSPRPGLAQCGGEVIVIARDITIALRGRWNAAANRGSARCPCHDDHLPSLSLSDGDEPGRILVHCFAGCDRRDILAALRERGLLECAHQQEHAQRGSRRIEPPIITPDPQALAIWGMASPVEHTIVQLYLRARLSPSRRHLRYAARAVATTSPIPRPRWSLRCRRRTGARSRCN